MYPLPDGMSLTKTPFGNSLGTSSDLTVGRTIQSPPIYKAKIIHQSCFINKKKLHSSYVERGTDGSPHDTSNKPEPP